MMSAIGLVRSDKVLAGRFVRSCLFASSAAAALAAAPVSVASESGTVIEEVIVTALKREQELSKVPAAVTAIGQDQLNRHGVAVVSSLSTLAPNLAIGTEGISNSAEITIRGITSTNATELGNPAVAFHVDGVYVPRPDGVNQLLFDVERIEVLRGPQGTLYGRNATAGSINVVTARPASELSGAFDVAAGNYQTRSARGIFNVPLGETLAMRASLVHEESDGYFDNRGVTENYQAADNLGGRLSLLFSPNDRLQWLLSVDRNRQQGTPALGVATQVAGTTPTSPRYSDGFPLRERPVNIPGAMQIDLMNVRSRIDWQPADSWSLAYVAGYGDLDRANRQDADGTAGGGSPSRNALFRYDNHYYNSSHELDLLFSGERVQLLLGAFYMKENSDVILESQNRIVRSDIQFHQHDTTQAAQALFADVTVALTDRLRGKIAARYSEDEMTNNGGSTLLCSPAFDVFADYTVPLETAHGLCPVLAVNRRKGEWSNTSWKVGFDADLGEDTLGYLSVGTGYKAGGFGDVGTPQFDPEEVTNYELGLKTRLAGDTLQLTTAVFYMDYTDLQVSQVQTVPVLALFTVNAAEASIYGAEVEWSWRLGERDRLEGFFSYLNATYDTFRDTRDPITALSPADTVDVSGNHLIRSPELSGRLSYEHRFELGAAGTLAAQIGVYWQSEMFFREFNYPSDHQDSYSRTDATLTWRSPRGTWSLEAFARNLEDEDVVSDQFVASVGLLSYYAAPRTYGIRLGYEF